MPNTPLKPLPVDRPWLPELDWESKAGIALSTLLVGLHQTGEEWLVNIFWRQGERRVGLKINR